MLNTCVKPVYVGYSPWGHKEVDVTEHSTALREDLAMNRTTESFFLSTTQTHPRTSPFSPPHPHTPPPRSHLSYAWLGTDQGVAHSRDCRGVCVSVQVRAAAATPAPPHNGAGVPCLSPKLFNGSVVAARTLEPPAMNLCWNEIKKKSHNLR